MTLAGMAGRPSAAAGAELRRDGDGRAVVTQQQASLKRQDLAATDAGKVRELRIGLVCYGGVSLAIYMHGITLELHHLVQASHALEDDAGSLDLDTDTCGRAGSALGSAAARAYYDVLRTMWRADPERVRTRVVIDVISGTSAGGINGVFLAKALAHDLPQGELADLWLSKGSIAKLFGRPWLPPLRGGAMVRWLHAALAGMDAGGGSTRSLMPDGYPLDLFVTTTDYYGRRQRLDVGDPATGVERHHREVLRFGYEAVPGGRDQFGSGHNPALALAARATSSFPGAFPALSLADLKKEIRRQSGGKVDPDIAALGKEFFRAYELESAKVADTYFMDGGVIDNAPLQLTIQEIRRRAAYGEARRVLVYLEPDPAGEPSPAKAKRPSALGTIWAGLSSVAGYEPILDDLRLLADQNQRVQRLRDIVLEEEEKNKRGSDDSIARRLVGIFSETGLERLESGLPEKTREELAEIRKAVENQALEETRLIHRSYAELRAHSILDQLAAEIADACDYPRDTDHARLVREIVFAWGRDRLLLGQGADPARQDELLACCDLGYLRRQVRFVGAWVDRRYGQPDPPRVELDRARMAVQKLVDELTSAIRGRVDEALLLRTREFFIRHTPSDTETLAAQARSVVAANGTVLDDLYQELGRKLGEMQDEKRAELYRSFREVTAGWAPELRRELVVRYLGFPFWDRLIYPYTAFSGMGELTEVNVFRISPADTSALPGETLQGVKMGHFGAFFCRKGRESDYLWGRLDGAERILALLRWQPPAAAPKIELADLAPVARAILEDEGAAKRVRGSILEEQRRRIAGAVERR